MAAAVADLRAVAGRMAELAQVAVLGRAMAAGRQPALAVLVAGPARGAPEESRRRPCAWPPWECKRWDHPGRGIAGSQRAGDRAVR